MVRFRLPLLVFRRRSAHNEWLCAHRLISASLGLGAISPGRCDLAPQTVRAALQRMSMYDLETETDLTEFDPSLDVASISALTAARWVCEVLAGFQSR